MRDFIVIGSLVVVAIIVGTALFYFGPSSLTSDVNNALTGSSSTTTVAYTELAKGTMAASITDRTNYRITNEADLTTLWDLVYGGRNGAPPQVDFSKNEVLAVFDGSHSTSGYGVQVASVADANAIRMVKVSHTAPGSTCMTQRIASSPFEMVQVPKTSFPLSHVDTSSTIPCPSR